MKNKEKPKIGTKNKSGKQKAVPDMVDIIQLHQSPHWMSMVWPRRLKDRDCHLDRKTRPYYMTATRNHFKYKDVYKVKVNVWRKIFHDNTNRKKTGAAALMSDSADFKVGELWVTERALHSGKGVNSPGKRRLWYVSAHRASTHVRQKEEKTNPLLYMETSTPLSKRGRSNRQEVSKDLAELNTIGWLDIMNICNN